MEMATFYTRQGNPLCIFTYMCMYIELKNIVYSSTLIKYFKNHVIIEEKSDKIPHTRSEHLNKCKSTFKIYSRFLHLYGLADRISRHISVKRLIVQTLFFFHPNDTAVNEKIIDM